MSPAPILLRPADADDAQALAEIYLRSRKTFLPYAPLARGDAEVRDWMRRYLVPGGGVVLAEREGLVAGFMAISTEGPHDWIDQLYVHPQHTGHGLGSALLQQALEAATQPLRLYCFQANAGARRLYERHGFVALALSDGRDNEERCPDVLYERPAQ